MCFNPSHKWYNDYGEYTIEEFVEERFLKNPFEMERFNRVIKHIPSTAQSVLDVGCGPGVFLYLLQNERDIKAVGIDISETNIRYAKEHLNVNAEKGDAASLRFEDQSFDVVVALEVLEHLPYETYEKALKEMARVARETIIISVPYDEERLFMTCPYCGTKFNSDYHLRSFKEDMLTKLFPGFTLVKVEKIGVNVWPKFIRKAYNFFKWTAAAFCCPACGYSRPRKKIKKDSSHKMFKIIKTVLETLSNIIPLIKKPREIIVIYTRL